MEKTIQQINKDLVLKAFDTLFNKRDYARLKRSGRRNTSSTAHTSRPGAKDCSIL